MFILSMNGVILSWKIYTKCLFWYAAKSHRVTYQSATKEIL